MGAVPPNFALKPGRREPNFWMRRQAPKIAAQTRERIQRPKFGNWAAENPRRNALFGVVSETCGLRRLDGGRTRARTWDPMIKSNRSVGQVDSGRYCLR